MQNPDVHPDVHHDHHHTLEFSENTNNQKLISLFTSSPGTRHFYSFTFDTCLLKTFDIFWLCFEKSNPVEKYRTDRPTVFFVFSFQKNMPCSMLIFFTDNKYMLGVKTAAVSKRSGSFFFFFGLHLGNEVISSGQTHLCVLSLLLKHTR